MKALREAALRQNHGVDDHPTKVGRVMHEFKRGQLHSGSKKGPLVTSRQQAIAIGLAEQRKQATGKKAK